MAKKSQREKWDDHVIKWTRWASEQSIEIEFELWTETDLREILLRENNANLIKYWFGRNVLNDYWFTNQVNHGIKALGERFNAREHVSVTIETLFDFIARTDKARDELINGFREFKKTKFKRIEKTDITIAVIFFTTVISTLTLSVLYSVPPLLTFLLGLSIMFLVAQFLMRKKDINKDMIDFIRDIEYDTLLFFVGVLLLVGALKEVGVLSQFTNLYTVMAPEYANYLMGILSAGVDNVPLTAALLKADIVMSQQHWLSFTYATGVGGSMLIIGSAAGIIAMSKVKELTFASYLRLSLYLLLCYTFGYAGSYLMGSFI